MKQLETLTRAISRRKINVVFSGSGAKTNGKTITLPSFGANAKLSDNQLAVIRGYCDHETEHVLDTNFNVLKGLDNKTKNMLNILEDIRIERQAAKKYHGAKLNLQALNAELLKPSDTPIGQLMVEGYRQVSGFKLAIPSYDTNVKKYFGADIISNIKGLKNTQDALDLAHSIIKMMAGAGAKPPESPEQDDAGTKPPEPPEPPEQDDSGDADEQDADEQDDSGDAGNTDGDEQGDADELADVGNTDGDEQDDADELADVSNTDGDEQDADEQNDASNTGNTDGGSGADTGENEDVSWTGDEGLEELEEPDAKEQKMEDFINQMAAETRGCDQYTIATTERDVVIPGAEHPFDDKYSQIKKNLGSLNTMRARFTQLFKTKIASKWRGNLDQGKLNTKRLARSAVGDLRVFRQKHKSQEMNTAVSLLVDTSGSMDNGKKIFDAQKAVVLFLELMNGVGIKTEVLGYTTDGRSQYDIPEYHSYTRHEGIVTYVYKTFAEPLNSKVKRIVAGIPSNKMNSNCDCESLQIASKRLLGRKESRKVMIVLTDGNQAFCTGNKMLAARELKRVIADIGASGIELIAIDIHSGHAASYYPKSVMIDRYDNLAEKLMSEMQLILAV